MLAETLPQQQLLCAGRAAQRAIKPCLQLFEGEVSHMSAVIPLMLLGSVVDRLPDVDQRECTHTRRSNMHTCALTLCRFCYSLRLA